MRGVRRRVEIVSGGSSRDFDLAPAASTSILIAFDSNLGRGGRDLIDGPAVLATFVSLARPPTPHIPSPPSIQPPCHLLLLNASYYYPHRPFDILPLFLFSPHVPGHKRGKRFFLFIYDRRHYRLR